MPHLKTPKEKEPLWKAWDQAAQKKGIRHTVYSVNKDQYTGEWLDNKKHGKGTYIWKETGCLYDGDWKKGKRSGFGTLSYPDGKGGYKKEYSGGWKNDLRHGYGTEFYTEEEFYEGEWYGGKRSGWGRMYFKDGTIYEGEWFDDHRNGQGMLRLVNENRHEGSWKDDMKNGPGKFYYLDSGQVFEGVWVNNTPKCGTMRDFGRENAPAPTQYPIPSMEEASIIAPLDATWELNVSDNTEITGMPPMATSTPAKKAPLSAIELLNGEGVVAEAEEKFLQDQE